MKKRVILASGSPRRAFLLNTLSIDFIQFKAEVDESVREKENPEEYVSRIAREKALKAGEKFGKGLIIGADTIVMLDSQIIQKPGSVEEAFEILSKLQGRDHFVYTGICVLDIDSEREAKGYTKTRVWFSPLTPEEIRRYVDSGEPMDKAGAYGIQAMGAFFVERIEGDFFSVMGLPLNLLWKLTKEIGSPLF
ncbi:MAG: Maf family protein [Candidatus Aminicenantia bacterium]